MISGEAIFVIILALVVGLFVIEVHSRIRTGKLIPRSTYSYQPFLRMSLIMLCFVIVIVLLIYFRTKSLEATLTIAVYVASIILGGLVFGLLLEYQVKRRGGRKVDWYLGCGSGRSRDRTSFIEAVPFIYPSQPGLRRRTCAGCSRSKFGKESPPQGPFSESSKDPVWRCEC